MTLEGDSSSWLDSSSEEKAESDMAGRLRGIGRKMKLAG
jgi:hypothetical protein